MCLHMDGGMCKDFGLTSLRASPFTNFDFGFLLTSYDLGFLIMYGRPPGPLKRLRLLDFYRQ